MDALHNQNVVFLKLHPVALETPGARFEIEFWYFDFLTPKQLVQLKVEKVQVHSVERLEIIVPEFVLRSVFPVNEIIVQFYHFRVHTQNLALLCQAQ